MKLTAISVFSLRDSAVAYTVALGLFLAVGRETTGNIPAGKVRATNNRKGKKTVTISV